ncbi:hypothetical protein ACFVS9_09610 [Streptomyces sp. NPDC058008]|uniref:hypothetical protein n=1 Tax=Streptomyces sp. NPDC058008 TaxID=3346303 RepID=UPI0036E67063
MRTRTGETARVAVAGAGTAGARPASRARGAAVTVTGEGGRAPYDAARTAGRPVRHGGPGTPAPSAPRPSPSPAPAGTSPLHPPTNDGGF